MQIQQVQQIRHQSIIDHKVELQSPREPPISLWHHSLQRAPTWETAASLWAVVRAGGAEILWLVVWYSIRQSLGQSVVRNEKEGYREGGRKGRGGWRAKITVASGVWQLAQAHANMQLEHLASRTYSGFTQFNKEPLFRLTFSSWLVCGWQNVGCTNLICCWCEKHSTHLLGSSFNWLNWIIESIVRILI